MERYDAETAEVLIFTLKDGLFSAVAHDLKLKVTRFRIELDETSVRAEFDADSLRVVTAMKDHVEHRAGLSPALFPQIEKNAAQAVLESRQFPTITFASTEVTPHEVQGVLTLHGQARAIRGKRVASGAEFSIDQRDFGMQPFSAMMGTLKVKPEVRVTVTLRTARPNV
jgi:hypothetical protein